MNVKNIRCICNVAISYWRHFNQCTNVYSHHIKNKNKPLHVLTITHIVAHRDKHCNVSTTNIKLVAPSEHGITTITAGHNENQSDQNNEM